MNEKSISLAVRIQDYLEDCSIEDLIELGKLVFGETDKDVIALEKEIEL